MKHFKIIFSIIFLAVLTVGCEEDTFIHNEVPITQSQSLIDPNAKATITPAQISALGKKNKSANIGYESAALGDIFVLDFEGLGNLDNINNFYNGGTSGSGFSGPNYGVEFGVALAIIDSDAGGTGNFANEPSPSTVMFFLDENQAFMNVSAGFDTGLSFFYSSATSDGFVSVYDALNGTGNLLGTIVLALNYNINCTGDPTGQFCNWDPIAVPFEGTAKSVVFSGASNSIAFDDVTFGSTTPGDLDSDGDGILDENDNCPITANPGQEDYDGDGIGDVCDDDIDGDGILNENDNCPLTANPEQADYDGDLEGDVCDADDDNDGCLDVDDPTPFSNIEATVDIKGCNTSVENRMTSSCGLTMSDMIDALEAGTYKNHGEFVRAMANLSNSWKSSGLISGKEHGAIMSCAGSSK
ncbi:thrombospondin type 3 repeat-containing protein [Algoriphagus ratkowskyi]|uniref:Thrombospondin type 3 repeat-containing protein n=2 Tax=Algoriphagus ratkowskyi TaxID=57028 RepID=A0A2W7R845_9BACT|nr:thrombospondin type 3 repeat-containing protein [Algoriphagus ratkowskyi]TXD79934.1 hypothetical protein ESW18_02040 [Algoriphagus ratkowskyi]